MTEKDNPELVESVNDYVSTDVISDLKSGIYNLFVSLVDYYTLDYGPSQGADEACKYLERLIATVREVLDNPTTLNDYMENK
jgi:hypothetical protein